MSRLAGAENAEKVAAWLATQSDDDLLQSSEGRGKINRSEIVKAIGCSYNVVKNNRQVKDLIAAKEQELRDKGVFPQETAKTKSDKNKPREYDKTQQRKPLELKRMAALEAENLELKAKLRELEARLERFGELSETLSEMGFMPR